MSTAKEIQSEEQKLEMTPMIDVTFLLLIFFMCTIEFKTLEGRLSAYLPRDVGQSSAPAEADEKIEISIALIAEGTQVHPGTGASWTGRAPRFEYAGREVAYRVGPREFPDLARVRTRLQQLYRADARRRVTIRAGSGAIYSDVVQVLDAAVEAGFTDISFR